MFDIFNTKAINNLNHTSNTNGSNTNHVIGAMLNKNNDIPCCSQDSPNWIGFDMAPASPQMFNLETLLAAEIGAQLFLKNILSNITTFKPYDFILIDCPPNLGILSVNGMAASQEIIIPIADQYMSLSGVQDTLRTMNAVRERLNAELGEGKILLCQYDKRTLHSRGILKLAQEKYKEHLFKTIIRRNVRLVEASSFAQPIISYDTRSSGAEDYRALAMEVKNDRRGNNSEVK